MSTKCCLEARLERGFGYLRANDTTNASSSKAPSESGSEGRGRHGVKQDQGGRAGRRNRCGEEMWGEMWGGGNGRGDVERCGEEMGVGDGNGRRWELEMEMGMGVGDGERCGEVMGVGDGRWDGG
ncbi:hypothetical protein Pmani_040108 [Petrolisthes manimaculis]|uniref:Uncharacterized protein n=1 Tax=Petrolisthes manimaculis TaxID=1843537 RepID=A0AAE1TIV5_9EUCA|nr:hypothetical protein Pmani_040108 [Petrolisthes manimaculis]